MLKKYSAFTLVELVIVILLIGILASVGVVNYFARRDKAIENEARAILQLICAAEKDVKETTGNYVSCNDTADCNSSLGLSIPSGRDRRWNYEVRVGGENFRAIARNVNNPNQQFFVENSCDVGPLFQVNVGGNIGRIVRREGVINGAGGIGGILGDNILGNANFGADGGPIGPIRSSSPLGGGGGGVIAVKAPLPLDDGGVIAVYAPPPLGAPSPGVPADDEP